MLKKTIGIVTNCASTLFSPKNKRKHTITVNRKPASPNPDPSNDIAIKMKNFAVLENYEQAVKYDQNLASQSPGSALFGSSILIPASLDNYYSLMTTPSNTPADSALDKLPEIEPDTFYLSEEEYEDYKQHCDQLTIK